MSYPTPPILPYATPEGIKEFVPLEDYNHLRIARAACERQYQEKVSELLFVMHERDEARAAIDELNGRLERLHRAIAARLSASEPTPDERLELRLAWEEAGKHLVTLPVRPNAAECGQCADNATFHLAPGEG
jgi:predicted nuclease with TOPRIM domain